MVKKKTTRKYNKQPTEKVIWDKWISYKSECKKNDWIATKNMWLDKLDISRKTYCEWKKKSNTLKKIEDYIENEWVQRLTGNNVAGTIFYLKNAFGYRDSQHLDVMSGGKPIPPFDYVKRTKNRNNNGNGENKKTN